MKKVLFIHGFASSSKSAKANDLRDMLNAEVIAPDLIHQPLKDIATLEEILRTDRDVEMIVGSSLGGFYGLFLASRHPHKLLLINPSLNPQITLQDSLGYVEGFKGGGFEWTKAQLEELKQLKDEMDKMTLEQRDELLSQCLVLLAEHDERLKYQEAVRLLKGASVVIDTKQDHRFSDLQPYKKHIRTMFHA